MDSGILVLSHVIISLIGIASGLIVMADLLGGRQHRSVTWIFLVTTAVTSASGFLFHRDHLLPSHIVGIVALIVMIPTWLAWSPYRLRGIWRPTFVIGAMLSQWLNVFVLIAQGFQKVPALHELAPTGSEPAFGIAQGCVFLLFAALTIVALRRPQTLPIATARG